MSIDATIIITPTGEIKFVWDDALAPLCDHGRARIFRAGDVEPSATGDGWMADLRRVGGGVHGPFRLRGDAMEVERLLVTESLLIGSIGEV